MATQYIKIESGMFLPKNEYVLVRPEEIEKEQKSESGFVIGFNNKDSALTRPSSGIVLSVGEDITDIKTGDFVTWPDTDGLDVEFTDGQFLILRYRSIIGRAKRQDEV